MNRYMKRKIFNQLCELEEQKEELEKELELFKGDCKYYIALVNTHYKIRDENVEFINYNLELKKHIISFYERKIKEINNILATEIEEEE